MMENVFKMPYKLSYSIILIFLILLSLNLILADEKVEDSFCGDMSDAGCSEDYAPVCYRDAEGSYYYICEFVGGDCSNNPSYNLDCSRKCDNEGHIYDYSSDRCCPPLSPYYHAGSCYGTTPFDDTDNYYTRHSNCVPSCRGTGPSPAPIPDFCKPEKCIGERLQRCETKDGWSFNYEDKGFVEGKCDVECISNADCEKGKICESKKCIIEEKCPSGQILCQDGLCKKKCDEKPPVNFLPIIIIIAIIGGLIFIFNKRR